MTVVILILVVAAAVIWISRWDVRRPDAVEARARIPFARPRAPMRRQAAMFFAAIAICLLALEILPFLDQFRFP